MGAYSLYGLVSGYNRFAVLRGEGYSRACRADPGALALPEQGARQTPPLPRRISALAGLI